MANLTGLLMDVKQGGNVQNRQVPKSRIVLILLIHIPISILLKYFIPP